MNSAPLRVWLVDDDASIRWVLERALRNAGMQPRSFDAAEHVLQADPTLSRPEHLALRELLTVRYRRALELFRVG